MIEYIKNMLIGLFVVVACSLLVGIILFLEPSVGDAKQTLVVRFSNINCISVGTRVMFAGKPVGEVVTIEQIPHAREQPTDELGQVYFYELTLHVDSSVRVYTTDEVTVQTSGLLGEKSIAIIPRAPPRGVKPSLVTTTTPMYAESAEPLESAFNELAQLADKVEETFDKIIAWIDQNGNELGAAIRAFDDAMTEATVTLSHVNKKHLVDDIKLGIENVSLAAREIHRTLEKMVEEDVFTNLAITMKNMKKTSSSVEKVVNNVIDGEGTLGKLFMDSETYLRLTSILSKADTLMNDVNHYGVFFNLNKEWQRTRIKRATLLNALDTPENFRNYFVKEVDLINTSMARLSMLANYTRESGEKEKMLHSKRFQEDFAELLRRTEELHSNLKLYNEDLIERLKK